MLSNQRIIFAAGATLTDVSVPLNTVGSSEGLGDGANIQPKLQFKDEGTAVGSNGGVTIVDFVGAGVAATHASGVLTVTVGGGAGSGDVVGPSSATDNAVARFDATTGKIIQNSVVTIADTTGNMAGVGTVNTHTVPGGTGTLALTSQITGTNSGTNTGDQTITLTGDVTGSGTGSFAATVANDAVTYAKIQNVTATSRILGRKTAGAGDTEECTLSEALDFVGSPAQGDILYRNATVWTRLGAGTNGHFLKTQGAAANPVWAAASGSGAVATDAIWDAKGDLAGGTGADTAARLAVGTNGQVLTADSAEATGLKWTTVAGTGDVVGPASATDNAVARFDTTTGKLIQNSVLIVDDSGNTSGMGTLTSGAHTVSSLTASRAVVSDGSKVLTSATATAAEVDFLSGVTSGIQAQFNGIKWKNAVRVATTANGTLATAYENGDTIDGIVLATGDRILLKDQTTASDNGIYIVAASGAPTRAVDGDAFAELNDAVVVVSAGTANADRAYQQTATLTALSDNQTWTQVWGSGLNQPLDATLTALAAYNTNGILTQTAADTFTGRTITGTTDKITVTDGNGVAGNPTLTIATGYVGQTSITTLGTITTGTWNGTDVAVADGGTGSSTAAGARTNLGLVIGTDVQAQDAELAAIAGLTSAADKLPYFTGSGTASVADFTTAGRALVDDASAAAQVTTLGLDNTKIASIGITIDGGGSAITTGVKGYIEVPYACTINRVTTLADVSGSIVIDVWRDSYVNYPPTVADTITASAKPTISSATKAQDSTLTGWTTAVSAGDILGFNVDSATTVTRVHLILKVTKT